MSITVGCGEKPVSEVNDFSSPTSQSRRPGESFAQAEERFVLGLSRGDLDAYLNFHSAKNLAQPWTSDFAVATTAFSSLSDLEAAFAQGRDYRFLTDADKPQTLRRSTWLYPDNGCYARADLLVRNMQRFGFPAAGKVFAFGPLTVATTNSPQGVVYWWYHVVPIATVDNEPFVFDPAVDASGPLALNDWVARIANDPSEVSLAVCHPLSYGPISRCLAPTDGSVERALTDQREFLPKEYERLEELGRDPEAELGDAPPWL